MAPAQPQLSRAPVPTATVASLEEATLHGSKKRTLSIPACRRQSETTSTEAEQPDTSRGLLTSGRVEFTATIRSAKRVCTEFKNTVDELFYQDQRLAKNCEWGLTKDLTRTADGGSDKTRIKELAEIVRTLRRVVRSYQEKVEQLQARVSDLVKRSSDGGNTLDGARVDQGVFQPYLLLHVLVKCSPSGSVSGSVTCGPLACRPLHLTLTLRRSAGTVNAQDARRVCELEASLKEMTVALDEANGCIEKLKADSMAREHSMHHMHACTDSKQLLGTLPSGSLPAGVQQLESDNKRLEEQNVQLEDQLREMRSKMKQLEVEVATLQSRFTGESNKLKSQALQAEVRCCQACPLQPCMPAPLQLRMPAHCCSPGLRCTRGVHHGVSRATARP
jgi:uncharacterized protein YlxW (UPF0749 family)